MLRRTARLLAEAESGDQLLVALFVGPLDVAEEFTATGYQSDQAATRGVVLVVGLKVVGQVSDTSGELGDLHVGTSCVGIVELHFAEIDFFGGHDAGWRATRHGFD